MKKCCFWDGSDLWPDNVYEKSAAEFDSMEDDEKCEDCPLRERKEATA